MNFLPGFIKKLNLLGRPQCYLHLFPPSAQKESFVRHSSLGEPQVTREYYHPLLYDEFENWCHYWFQIRAVLGLNPEVVLEIGTGTGIVSDYLKNQAGLKVTTFDIDPDLKPEVVGNVVEIDNYFEPLSFDVVLCAQILEHLPFDYFIPTLEKLTYLCRTGLVLGLPRYGRMLSHSPRFGRLIFRFDWMIPKPKMLNSPYPFSGGHYWEINTSKISDRVILNILYGKFAQVTEISVWGNPYLVLYTCENPKR